MMKTSSNSSANLSDSLGIPVINFTTQLTHLKDSLSAWENIVATSSKLSASLRTMIQCYSYFLDTLNAIADIAYSSNCGLRELGSSITRFCLRERAIEVKLKNINTQLTDCLATPLAHRIEEWRRAASQLDRENSKEWRRARSEFVRATNVMKKLHKRCRRKLKNTTTPTAVNYPDDKLASNTGPSTKDDMHMNFVQQDLAVKRRTVAELDRLSLRKTCAEDRRRFAEFMTCLKPLLDSHTSLFNEADTLQESISMVTRNAVFDPNELPAGTEQAIDMSVERQLDCLAGGGGDARAHGSGNRGMRLLKNLSFNRGDLANNSSGSTTSLAAARIPVSTWAAMAANIAAQAMDESRQLDDHKKSFLATTSSLPPMTNGRGDNEDLGGSPASPTHLSVTAKTDFQPSQGGSVSQPQSADGAATSPTRLQLDNCGQTIHPPPTYSSFGPRTTSGSQEQQHQRYSSLPPQASLVPNSGFTAVEEQQFADKEDEEEDEDGDHLVHGSGSDSTDDHLSDDRLSQDDDDTDSYRSTGRLPQKSCLYPNQALPAPVYTNLSELKRAAARKFGGSHADVSWTVNRRSLIEGSRTGAADTTSLHGGLVSMGRQDGSPLRRSLLRQISNNSRDDYLPDNSQSDAGTSTFGRRQPEYACVGVNAAAWSAGGAGGLCDLAGFGYQAEQISASVTPGLVRRSGNYGNFNSNSTGTNSVSSSRPVYPPHRSTSVRRYLTDSDQPILPPPPLPIGLLPHHGDHPNPDKGPTPHAFYLGGASGAPQPGDDNLLPTNLRHQNQFQQAQQQRQQQLLQRYSSAVASGVTNSPAHCLPPLAPASHVTVTGSGGTGLVPQVSRPNSARASVCMPSAATPTVSSKPSVQQLAAAVARKVSTNRGKVANSDYPVVSDAMARAIDDNSSAAPAIDQQRQSSSGSGLRRGQQATSFNR